MTPKRIVLDTNIWLDWLVFRDSSVLHLRDALAARADCLVTKDHKLLELARRTRPFRILDLRKLSVP